MLILHPVMGVVIGGNITIGSNLTLVGGNIIGRRNDSLPESLFSIGNNIVVGGNATIIGPITIGNNIVIGALACVVKSVSSEKTLIGIPACEK